MSMTIKEPLKKVPAAHHSGRRSMKTVRVVCLHSTEGEMAAGAASWFANPASGGSAHIAVDAREGYRCLADDFKPWANGWNQTLDMEHAAFARWRRTMWLTPGARRMLRRSAFRVARWCHQYDIPAQWVNAVELRRGKSGVTMHYTISKAFHTSDHSDPGKGFPKRRYIRMVRKFKRELNAPANGRVWTGR